MAKNLELTSLKETRNYLSISQELDFDIPELNSPQAQRSIFEHYSIFQEIGRGAFSVVKRGKHKLSGKECAIKCIKKKFVPNRNSLNREIQIMKRLKHRNILILQDFFENRDYIFLVLDLITGGELFEKIVEFGCAYEEDAQFIVKQILEAVNYLHDCGIVHRDLKPENILCANDFEETRHIYLSDFGLSRIFSENEKLTTFCGSPEYLAPEIINCAPYGKCVDLWSVGVITYFLLSGTRPFDGATDHIIFEKIRNLDYTWDDSLGISNLAKHFVQSLLVKNPSKRLTAQQALQHPWIQSRVGLTN